MPNETDNTFDKKTLGELDGNFLLIPRNPNFVCRAKDFLLAWKGSDERIFQDGCIYFKGVVVGKVYYKVTDYLFALSENLYENGLEIILFIPDSTEAIETWLTFREILLLNHIPFTFSPEGSEAIQELLSSRISSLTHLINVLFPDAPTTKP